MDKLLGGRIDQWIRLSLFDILFLLQNKVGLE